MNSLKHIEAERELLAACKEMLAYIEMRLAHTGAQDVDTILRELARVQSNVSFTETAHHLGCPQTTRRVDLNGARAAIARFEANLRLIAAAPELLAALKVLVDIYCPVQDGYSSATVRAWKNAEQAIAKATGGQA